MLHNRGGVDKESVNGESLDEWPLPVAHQRSKARIRILIACVAAVSLDDDLVDALIGSIRGHIISFSAFHHQCVYL